MRLGNVPAISLQPHCSVCIASAFFLAEAIYAEIKEKIGNVTYPFIINYSKLKKMIIQNTTFKYIDILNTNLIFPFLYICELHTL